MRLPQPHWVPFCNHVDGTSNWPTLFSRNFTTSCATRTLDSFVSLALNRIALKHLEQLWKHVYHSDTNQTIRVSNLVEKVSTCIALFRQICIMNVHSGTWTYNDFRQIDL